MHSTFNLSTSYDEFQIITECKFTNFLSVFILNQRFPTMESVGLEEDSRQENIKHWRIIQGQSLFKKKTIRLELM